MPPAKLATNPSTTTPEEFLQRAMAAQKPSARARYAERGLASRGPIDRTTQAMLLRQLYLAHFEQRRFSEALVIAHQAITLNVLPDVLSQDAARAALASGDLEGALFHLRTAARKGPPSRRPFHLWTLGSVLFLAGRYDDAISTFTRALRWGTRDKPLYRAHLELARIASGQSPRNLQQVIDELAAAPCGQGYGRFVLGHLAYAAGEWTPARKYLEAFVQRTESSRTLVFITLESEVAMARATLTKIANNYKASQHS